MNPQSKLKVARNVPILIAAAVIALVCLAEALPRFLPELDAFRRFEWMSYDWRMRRAAAQPGPYATNLLAGVLITDQDLKELNDGTYGYHEKFPWPTHYYGMVVRELTRQGAKVIGFDVLFELLNRDAKMELPGGEKTGSDDFFASQIRRAGNAVLAVEVEGDVFSAEKFRTNAAQLGNIYTRKDSDAVLRRVKPFSERRVWHGEIRSRVRSLNLDLSRARFHKDRIVFPRTDGEAPYEVPLNPDGSLRLEELTGQKSAKPEWPCVTERIWNLGIVLAARELNLDLAGAVVRPGQIILRGPGGTERRIPTDEDGFFYINWSLKFKDPRIQTERIAPLIREDYWRQWRHQYDASAPSRFRGKLVVIGSTGTGGNISDLGATPLEHGTPLVTKHLNVANSIITGRFIRPMSAPGAFALIVVMGVGSALLTWKLRALLSSLLIVLVILLFVWLGVFLFARFGYWVPMVLPLAGALFMTHVCMITYRVRVEQKEKRRVRSVFSKIVSPDIVNELLKADHIAISGARRRVSIYFADIRGFTRMTDEIQVQADEHIREHKLPPAAAEAYLDKQAGELLNTISLYLGVIADTIIEHGGTLDKYIGDCVLAFWGAPIPNDRHPVDCVWAAIDAQRAIYELNLGRAAENQRREQDNVERVASGRAPLPMLRLLALGSGINTGMATVGLMGSDKHRLDYTVLGREVNLANRLEGISGRGRIIISDSTYQDILRMDPELASTCLELPPQEVKGFREVVKVYEVQWRQTDPQLRTYDTGILTGAKAVLRPDIIAPAKD